MQSGHGLLSYSLAVVDLIKMLLEHRILGAINEYIDAHSGPILDAVRPFLTWFVHAPFVLLALTGCGILIHAYIGSERQTHKPQSPTEPPAPPTPTTSVRQEANPTVIVNANPIVHASPKIEIHTHTPQREPIRDASRLTPPATHNVQFAGAKRIATDFEREVFDGNGILGVRACFLNRTIPDRQVSDLDSATARIVIKDPTGRVVAETDRPKWLNHETAQFVDIRANTMECILLAIHTNEDNWLMPCLVQGPPNYWDRGCGDLIIDGQQLPDGELEVEITLASGNGLGLQPVTLQLSLGRSGQVGIDPSTR